MPGSAVMGVMGLVVRTDGVNSVSGEAVLLHDARDARRVPWQSPIEESEEKKLDDSEGQSVAKPSEESLSKSVVR